MHLLAGSNSPDAPGADMKIFAAALSLALASSLFAPAARADCAPWQPFCGVRMNGTSLHGVRARVARPQPASARASNAPRAARPAPSVAIPGVAAKDGRLVLVGR
jgi:hypothetical protein